MSTFAMQVAGQVKPRYSLVGGADDNDCIFFSRSVLQCLDLLNRSACTNCLSDTSRAAMRSLVNLQHVSYTPLATQT
jgi:hypothetical protein